MKKSALKTVIPLSLWMAGIVASQAAAPATPLGYAKVKEFTDIGGTAITDLTDNAKYPNRPDSVAYPTYLEWPQTGDINVNPPGDVKNNYGVIVQGYFYPTDTKAHTFIIAADDNAQFWLSTDEDPANKKLICREPEWNGVRNWDGTDRRPDGVNKSAEISLTKGKAYYFEALMKEGGGGDNLAVSIDGTLPIPGSQLSPFEPSLTAAILSQPQDQFVFAGGSATFSVATDVPPPTTITSIKWQKNGVDIPDSNRSTLTLAAAAGDHNAKIRAVIALSSGGPLTSAEATLTVATIGNEFSSGVVKFEAYHDISGTPIQGLLDSEKYPGSPDNVRILGALDTPNGYGENYGGRVTGFIIPPEDGSYRFFIRSDDASQFYLNTTAGGPAPVPGTDTPIAEETGCCNGFTEPDSPRTSEPVALKANSRYAFVALVKEGGGGDYLQVAVRKEGTSTPAGSLTPISGSWIGANARPSLGTPVITTQPTGIAQLIQGRAATLTIAAQVTPTQFGFPAVIQWRRNGTAIPGANGTSYTIASAAAGDSGTYTAVVSAPSGQSVTSAEAVVNVVNDTFAPKIAKVQATSVSTLIVSFDEPVDSATAGAAANYALSSGVTISSATASENSVLLNTSALTVGANYVLTVGGVKDLFGNTVPANTQVSFKATVVTYADVILADKPVMFYRFEESAGQKTVNLGTAGAEADGLWMTGSGPDDSAPVNASSGNGPRPGGFLGFAADNRSGKFTGQEGLLWVDAQKQLLNNLPAFTLEYWVKPANRATDPTAFGNRIGIVGQNDAIEYGFINPNTIQIWTPGGGALDTTYSFPDGEWHHVATIADGRTIKNYFDGKFINQTSQNTANYGSSTFNVHVGGGGAFDATGNHFTGEIDEVAIFTKAIPADRVAAHFKAGKEGGAAASADPAVLKVNRTPTGIQITWDGGGTLQSAASPAGPWNNVANATSPYSTAASSGAAYFRVAN